MKRKRIILGIAAIAAAALIDWSIYSEWKDLGCDPNSIGVGIAVYTIFIAVVWFCLDTKMRGK